MLSRGKLFVQLGSDRARFWTFQGGRESAKRRVSGAEKAGERDGERRK